MNIHNGFCCVYSKTYALKSYKMATSSRGCFFLIHLRHNVNCASSHGFYLNMPTPTEWALKSATTCWQKGVNSPFYREKKERRQTMNKKQSSKTWVHPVIRQWWAHVVVLAEWSTRKKKGASLVQWTRPVIPDRSLLRNLRRGKINRKRRNIPWQQKVRRLACDMHFLFCKNIEQLQEVRFSKLSWHRCQKSTTQC